MRRSLAAFALLCFAGPGIAQSPAPVDSSLAKFIGVWEGSFTSTHLNPGGMRLEIARDSVWTLSTSILVDQPINGDGTGIRIDATHVAWTQITMGTTCQGSSALEGNALKGRLDCGGNAAVDFELRKRP